jgi:hypothetical protein
MSSQTYTRFETKTRSAKPAVQTRKGNKPSYETSGAAQRRFTSEIKVDPRYMSALIGTEGCNIRRITSKVRNGLYIRGDGDKFLLTAYSQEALKEAALIILEDQRCLKNPSSVEAGTKPSAILEVDPETVAHIVGKAGAGLKKISQEVGDGCFIVHREQGFYITANNSKDLERAKAIIRQQEQEFKRIPKVNGNVVFVNLDLAEEEKHSTPKPKRLVVEKPVRTKGISNGFAALMESDSEEEVEHTPVKTKQLNPNALWAPKKVAKKETVVEEFPAITLTITPKPKSTVEVSSNWGNSAKVTQIAQDIQQARFTDSEKLAEQKRKRQQELAQQVIINRQSGPTYVDLDLDEYESSSDLEEETFEETPVAPVVSHNINIAIVTPVSLPTAPARKITSWADECSDLEDDYEEPTVYGRYEDSW